MGRDDAEDRAQRPAESIRPAIYAAHAGREWARAAATPEEREGMLAYRRSCFGEGRDGCSQGMTGKSTQEEAYELYYAMRPEHDGDRAAAAAFWEGVLGAEAPRVCDGDFLNGFMQGALGPDWPAADAHAAWPRGLSAGD
jgi:hypothetical protein